MSTKIESIKKKLKSLPKTTLRRFKRYLRKNMSDFREVERWSRRPLATILAEKYEIEEVSSMINKLRSKHRSKETPDGNTQQTTNSNETGQDANPPGNAVWAGNTRNMAQSGGFIFTPQFQNSTVNGDVVINCQAPNNTQIMGQGAALCCPTSANAEQVSKQMEEENDDRKIIEMVKSREKKTNQQVTEGTRPSQKSPLDSFYTELYIVASEQSSINGEHETWHVENSHILDPSELCVKYHDLFKDQAIKRVLTKGIAGIGKTVTIAKFIMDWANEKIHIDIVINLPFRKMNLLSSKEHSLLTLLQVFHPYIKDMTLFSRCSSLLILDGLDEAKFPLDFKNNVIMSDVNEKQPVDVLLTNLLNGHLLPNTRLWITARPEAANNLLRQDFYIEQVNVIRGFNDAQKDAYFKMKIKDKKMADDVIKTLKQSRSLYIMCHIPVFSWMSAMVLQNHFSKMTRPHNRALPTTITEMYIQYLVVQTVSSSMKYEPGQCENEQTVLKRQKDIILNLGKLAYDNLMRKNVLFTAEDMKSCGISPNDAAKCPGLCTENCYQTDGLFENTIFSFVHLTIQEFMAAFHAFYTFANELKPGGRCLLNFLKEAVDKALKSQNGHLDLYVRFLFGITNESSRVHLKSIFPDLPSTAKDHKRLISYIKVLKREGLDPVRCINLIHCLIQLKDHFVLEDLTSFLSTDKPLTEFQCTCVAYNHIVNKLEEFDFRNTKTSDKGFNRLVPALCSSFTAKLCFCEITPPKSNPSFTASLCATLASVLRSDRTCLTTLFLSRNNLGGGMAVDRLCDGLNHCNCSVEVLDLSFNDLGTEDIKKLCDLLATPTLRLLTLDLSNNDLGDHGVGFLAEALCHSTCKLQVLRLSGCGVTKATSFLNRIQMSDSPVKLKELDLSYNPLKDGDHQLVQEFKNLGITVKVEHVEDARIKPGLDKYSCDLTLDAGTANRWLSLSEGGRKVIKMREMMDSPTHPEMFDGWTQVLSKENLSHRHYIELDGVNDVSVGMAYNKIPRKGKGKNVKLGANVDSWILYVFKDKCHVQHNNRKVILRSPAVADYCRIGIYLDWPAGVLCFYSNNDGNRVLLYAFHTTFLHPLHLALEVGSPKVAVELIATAPNISDDG